jgi:intracellular multiplication protein IcmJ
MPMPKKRPIVLSAKRRSWRMMDAHADEHDKRYQAVREQVLQRDDYTCVFCMFRSVKYQHIHHMDDDHGNNKLTNLVTACPLCHQCFHLGMAGIRKAGVMVWMPEIPQAELNNLCRAIFVAVQNSGEHEQAARSLYVSLESRAAVLETELGAGSSNPAAFGQAFLHMKEEQYAQRAKMMAPVRLLPRMQAFGTEISFWQGDASAFGALADADWSRVAPPADAYETALPAPETEGEPLLEQSSASDDSDLSS